MKKLAVVIGWFLVTTWISLGGIRDAAWKAVDEAVRKGLPKTAITNLEPIIQGALQDKAYAEATKAIARKIALEGTVEGNKPEEKITRLEAAIKTSPPEIRPMLETILAHWYWQYFQQNRWRFSQRTATAAAPGADFTTWDLSRLFAEIDRHFQIALSADKILKATPVSEWNDLLVRGTMPDKFRPTLYDFLVHQALEFYQSGEQAAAKPEDNFELSAESPVLDSTEAFLAWKPAANSNSPVLQAIRLYQELLRFHQPDPEPRPAFADADLARLAFGWNTAFGEDKNARYRAALQRWRKANPEIELVPVALEREARIFQLEGDLVSAHKLATQGRTLFPTSPGAALCRNLVAELEAKSVEISTERVWNCSSGRKTPPESCPSITLRYRNLDRVYFRVVPANWESFLQRRHHRPESLSAEERAELLSRSPVLEWNEKLPPTTDFKQRVQRLAAPTSLPPGFYFILSSHKPDFPQRDTNNIVCMADFWVSTLSLITRTRQDSLEGMVLDADSGEPVAGAEVAAWSLDNRSGNRVPLPLHKTDANGTFTIDAAGDSRNYVLRVRQGNRELANAGDLWVNGRPSEPEPRARTVFFTDRALYRPGQSIQYKGICLWVDQTKDDYRVLPRESVTVIFRDPNGQEIARQEKVANDYGSFAGVFTAPRDRLMGQMTLVVEGRAQGAANFSVEEYKRPKFEVTLNPPAAARLNEKVTLKGTATSYTGAAIDQAQVSFHVVRQVQFPWWWRGSHSRETQEIAHGFVKTGTDGSFEISFLAKADPSVPEKSEPTFTFLVSVDVTDSAGETRSATRATRLGFAALAANLSADDWQVSQTPVELKISTTTLDGEPVVAEGAVKIFALAGPAKVHRAVLGYAPEDDKDLSEPTNWDLAQVAKEQGFTTSTNGLASISAKLNPGFYRAVLETQDVHGKKVTAQLGLRVVDPKAATLRLKVPNLVAAPSWEKQPGEDFMALWGTGYESGRAFVEIESRGKILQRYWTKPGRTQQAITLPVTEALRGGFTLHVTQVRENRAYLRSFPVQVPWSNKDLDIKWEHFSSKLEPAKRETWTAVITGPKAEKCVAEMVATLYDESLDAFRGFDWIRKFDVFRQDYSSRQAIFANQPQGLQHSFGEWRRVHEAVQMRYRDFPQELTADLRFYGYFSRGRIAARSFGAAKAVRQQVDLFSQDAPVPAAAAAIPETQERMAVADNAARLESPAEALNFGGVAGVRKEPAGSQPDLSKVSPRKNLNETAFFFPQLVSDSNGIVRLSFTMPEALTRWHFLAFAHDARVRSGFLEDQAVTAKDLMVQPNPPRFLREGDTIEFTVKISNQSDTEQIGSARLSFRQARDNSPADELLGLRAINGQGAEQPFTIPAKQSISLAWRLTVPDGCGFLTYEAVAATAKMSDGEAGAIPVLSRRILVTEGLPLPIRGPATEKFVFTNLVESAKSKSLRNESLTVQMVSNPAWYAVLALPYLIEFPYECTEQTFNRFYANVLARSIALSDPKIHRVFEQWRNTPALESPLEKNADLKNVALEETPWVRQAQSETQARHNIGLLFDDNRLNSETTQTLQKLTQMQNDDGRWPWFPGGPGNDYMTLYITTGFGRLRHLKVDVEVGPALRALESLDRWMTERYEKILRQPHPEDYVLSPTDALYLYCRSFFLKDRPIASVHQKATDFYLAHARKFWLETGNRQTQGHLALALHRFNEVTQSQDATPRAIMASLKERSVTNKELGMFWRDTELSWWWYRAPIETQALMIEAFDEVAADQEAVEGCRTWLLKQKQTQDWKTTKATADAVYALLLRGRDILASDTLVQVKVGDLDLTPRSNQSVEAGTGFYEKRFPGPEVKPDMGHVTVTKSDEGVAWGSIHWQYLEDMSKVTPYEGTPLKLKKAVLKKVTTGSGQTLQPLGNSLEVGDELVTRIELRTDRDMEYVHLKDQRGSGTEPVNVMSHYRYQDGLAYYESTRDTASHFFIDYLPKGTYVFEYSSRVQLRGEYQTGIAEIQCMYAPEFNSHSESLVLEVK